MMPHFEGTCEYLNSYPDHNNKEWECKKNGKHKLEMNHLLRKHFKILPRGRCNLKRLSSSRQEPSEWCADIWQVQIRMLIYVWSRFEGPYDFLFLYCHLYYRKLTTWTGFQLPSIASQKEMDGLNSRLQSPFRHCITCLSNSDCNSQTHGLHHQ